MWRVEQLLRKSSSKIWVEPVIPVASSFIKPDRIMEREWSVIVMDVLVVSVHRMDETWRIKVEKYGSPSNHEYILA